MNAKLIVKRVAKTALGLDFFMSPDITVDYSFLGTDYGGWPVIPRLTKPDSIVYSFGVGEDASFDLALIQRFGCRVHAFDPTPKSMKWVNAQALPSAFEFHPIGIGAKPGELTLYPPANPNHVSFTLKENDRSTGDSIKVPVSDLPTIMSELGHDHIDILKMDVEGAEYDVVEELAHQPVRPPQLMVEFHHGMYGYRARKTQEAITELRRLGYQMYYRSKVGHEFGFALASMLR